LGIAIKQHLKKPFRISPERLFSHPAFHGAMGIVTPLHGKNSLDGQARTTEERSSRGGPERIE